MKHLKPFFILCMAAFVVTGCLPSNEPTEPTPEQPTETPTTPNTPSETQQSTAPVRIVEYFDFACGYCARSSAVNSALKAKYGDKLEITHKSMNNYSQSTPVHKAFACVAEQDKEKGADFASKYFADYMGKYDDESIEAVATIIGADIEAMNECVASDVPDAILAQQKQEAAEMGANGTPFFVINEYTIQPGFLAEAAFSHQIDKILEKAGAGALDHDDDDHEEEENQEEAAMTEETETETEDSAETEEMNQESETTETVE